MVVLKEITEGIWGLVVGPEKTVEVITEHPIRLTMAALDVTDDEISTNNPRITRVTLKSVTADRGPATDLILCNLSFPSCLQQPLDIEFYDGQTLTFGVQGAHRVHLTGYRLQPEPEQTNEEDFPSKIGLRDAVDYEEESDEDDDDDDDDEDDDEDEDEDEDDIMGFVTSQGLDDEESDDESIEEEESKPLALPEPKGKKRSKSEANGNEQKKKKVDKSETPTVKEQTKNGKNDKKTKKKNEEIIDDSKNTKTPIEEKKKSNQLEMKDLRPGNGPEAKPGKTVAVYYTGRLQSNNSVFDSCAKGKPFRFRLGAGEVIRGWDQGVKGMRVGGKRQLIIPPSLAYGNQRLPDIPPNSTLIFDVELKHVF